ncbi:MAG TPA: lysophospholipid acyltransferase family protein [Candidatus Polarisedimenticolia bacterium]|nr:lysophospholipid acyltransferase family protein [Candidatus Polarisedimenticolia bacterium]
MESPSTLVEPAPAASPAHRRWYSHRFNTPLAWELIQRITPRLPRWILVPLHHATSLFFLLILSRERSASRSNLQRITGKEGWGNLTLTYRLFFNFSRFLVAYTEIPNLERADFRKRIDGAEETERLTLEKVREGKGLIVATAHLGHWDLGLKFLPMYGVPVHVVILEEDSREVGRYAEKARSNPNLRVHRMGSTPLLALELMLALKRGEVVAIQVDRAAGQSVMTVPFFGEPAPLPTGPVELAMASGAPILPVFIVFDRGRRYRIVTMEPMYFKRGGGSEETLPLAMRRMAAMLESVIRRYPDQWFNFYDVWRSPAGDASEEHHA